MKKLLLCLILMGPLFVSAQTDPPLFIDFAKGIKGIKSSFAFNEHLNVMQIVINDANFVVVAVNEQMQLVWRASLTGHAMSVAKFKDKVIAIGATEYTNVKGPNNTYKATILDPANGKVLLEKVIFDGSPAFTDYTSVLISNNTFWGLGVRQSAVERKMHWVGFEKQYNETKALDVILFDDKLNPVNAIKPSIIDAPYLGMQVNKQGDVFIEWLVGGHINAYKYELGKSTPIGPLASDIGIGTKADLGDVINDQHFRYVPSTTNMNMVYYTLLYLNGDNKAELGVGSFDLVAGKKQYVTESFEKDHIKALTKAFITVNKKLDDPDLGNPKDLSLKYFAEENGTVVVGLNSHFSQTGMNGYWEVEKSILINGYDANLGVKFQQFLPASSSFPNIQMPVGFHLQNNKLHVIAIDKHGMNTMNTMYGALDIPTGKWDKMLWLSKKKIDNSDYADGPGTMWFNNSFIVPNISPKGISQSKFDVTLQQNGY